MDSKISFTGDFSRVNEEEREFLNKDLEKFTERHEQDFNEMHLKIDCKMHKETSRGRPSYFIKLTLVSDRGRFHSENQDFGAEKTLVGALRKLDVQIDKHRQPK